MKFRQLTEITNPVSYLQPWRKVTPKIPQIKDVTPFLFANLPYMQIAEFCKNGQVSDSGIFRDFEDL